MNRIALRLEIPSRGYGSWKFTPGFQGRAGEFARRAEAHGGWRWGRTLRGKFAQLEDQSRVSPVPGGWSGYVVAACASVGCCRDRRTFPNAARPNWPLPSDFSGHVHDVLRLDGASVGGRASSASAAQWHSRQI